MMDSAALKAQVSTIMGLLSETMTDDMYSVAESITIAELGWDFPIDNRLKEVWMVKRCRRHVCDIVIMSYASSVKHKQTSHNQKYEHLKELITTWDKEFSEALETQAYLFAGVDPKDMFGTKADSSFVYDMFGRDITDYGT